MRLPGLLASLSSSTLILLAACGGSVNTKLDAPSATSTRMPQRSVPPAATIGAADGVAFCKANACDVKTYLPLTATPTASPVPTPVPLPGEACPPLTIDREEPGIYVFDLTTCELGRFNAAKSDGDVAWSPDGSRLAFARSTAPSFDAESNIFILDLQDGSETQVTYTPGARKYDLSWSPDGSALAFYSRPIAGNEPSADAGLWILQLGSLKRRMLHPDAYHYCLHSWSPDSAAIAVGCTHGDFYLIDVSSGERHLLDQHYGFGEPAWSPSGELIAYSCENVASGPYFACSIRADGSGRVMFPDNTSGAIWNFAGDQVVFQGAKLFFGDPETGKYVRVMEEWEGGTPQMFVSERVLVGFTCGSVAPCAGIRLITDIESRKTIRSVLGTGAEWSPNGRYLAFAINDFPGPL